MIAIVWFQSLLYGIGSVLAALYRWVPNYGVAIILLTLVIRVILLPLGIKQVRSMQAMQAIQPKVKALQQKYKGNRQKLNEETMALYKEYGVNPLSGCVPLLAQFPVLIALFAVLRVPTGLVHIPHNGPYGGLHADIRAQAPGVHFLGANLLCSAVEAGRNVPVTYKAGTPESQKLVSPTLNCGKGVPVRIPYYVFSILMVATTYYQQRQMQRASPGPVNQQQQTLTRVMPILFGVWGFIFPAGLVVYWTTTNLVQIAQQHFMLPKSTEATTSERKGTPEDRPRPSTRPRRDERSTDRRPSGSRKPNPRSGGKGGTSGGARGDGRGTGRQPRLGSRGQGDQRSGSPSSGLSGRDGGAGGGTGTGGSEKTGGTGTGGTGARDGGDRKKRRKR